GSQHVSARVLAFSVYHVGDYLDVTQAGHQWILLRRPRSKFPTDGSTNWCLANAVLLDFLLLIFSWIRPPILPSRNLSTLHPCTPYNPSNTVNVQGTKYLGRTHLRSPVLFPPARLPLLLAVCQQPTTLST
ncbi:hypothetical protein ILYODFUR_036563, partial [Ilyodon furcidens]